MSSPAASSQPGASAAVIMSPSSPYEAYLSLRRPSRLLSSDRRAGDGTAGNAAVANAECVGDPNGPPVVKKRSVLQRLGVAPIIDTRGPGAGFDYADQAPRSPVGAVRGGSTMKRDVSKLAKRRISAMMAAETGHMSPDEEAASPLEDRWHLISEREFFGAFGTSRRGLTESQVTEQRVKFGPNALTPPPKVSFLKRLFLNLSSPFSMIMILGSILTFIITAISSTQKDSRGRTTLDRQNLALSCVLIGVAFLTSLFQTLQENASDNLMEALHGLTAEDAWVFRRKDESSDPEMIKIPASEIVPGEVVQLNIGEKVPADLRIIECNALKVNNAALTGENIDIKLSVEANHESLFEAKNIARSGCIFTNGNGLGVVFATGDKTFFGQIAKSATTADKPDSLMRREVKRLVICMGIGGAIFGFTFFAAAFGTGLTWIQAVIILVGLFVADIPEGLLPQITIALTITARKMFAHNVIVSSLEIIETLGAVSVICSDKTGTLTLNRMTVAHFVLGGDIVRTTHGSLLPQDSEMINIDEENSTSANVYSVPLNAIIRAIQLNSDACFIDINPAISPSEWIVKGDASETALLKFVQARLMRAHTSATGMSLALGAIGNTNNNNNNNNNNNTSTKDTKDRRVNSTEPAHADGVDYIKLAREENKRLAYLPFHSKNKYMASINVIESGSSQPKQVILVKGAAERVIARCDKFMERDGTVVDMDDGKKARLSAQILELARRAERVFGFAHSEISMPEGFDFEDKEGNLAVPLEKLTFLGMASMIDPPRPTVPQAIKDCHKAGIHVIMVTGDHPETAVAISKSLGLITLPLLSDAVKAKKEAAPATRPLVNDQRLFVATVGASHAAPPTTGPSQAASSSVFSDENPNAVPREGSPTIVGATDVAVGDRVVVETTIIEADEPDEYEGIDFTKHSVVVTGDDITHFTQKDWDRVLSCKEHCFARTQPEQKQMIVWRLQERGQIVAMTGDGVNDAPALKAANVGVAVGSGTAVAKEAGQIIISDDDFNSIVVGVREGRVIFENLKKAVTFVTSHALPEILPYVVAFAADMPIAIETIVILLIDLGTDMLPGIAIAYETVDDRIMSLPPRSASDHLISSTMIVLGYIFAGLQISFFAYWNFFWVFIREYKIPFTDLKGATQGTYRSEFVDLDTVHQTYYTNLCAKTASYYESRGGPITACNDMEAFLRWFEVIVSEAQATYFIGLAYMQFANCLSRRQQVMSAFDPKQKLNWRMTISVCFSICWMCFFVYVPGLNEAFYLRHVRSDLCLTGAWGIGVVILIEEIRKVCCRAWPTGVVARLSLF